MKGHVFHSVLNGENMTRQIMTRQGKNGALRILARAYVGHLLVGTGPETLTTDADT